MTALRARARETNARRIRPGSIEWAAVGLHLDDHRADPAPGERRSEQPPSGGNGFDGQQFSTHPSDSARGY